MNDGVDTEGMTENRSMWSGGAGTGNRPTGAVVAVVGGMAEYQTRILRAAHRILQLHDIPLLVHSDAPLERGARSRLLGPMLRDTPPLGILDLNPLEPDEQEQLAALLASVGVPIVHVGNARPGAACVSGDNAEGMAPLLAHLLDHRGARRVVLLRGIPHHPDSIAREAVFRSVLANRAVTVDEGLVVTGGFMPEPAYAAMRELLTRRRDFDAVVALNDAMAVAAITALQDVGIRVPEDVAVTGFDNDRTALRWPGLTTVDQGYVEQGEAAALLLLEQMTSGPVARRIGTPSWLAIRGSTASVGQPTVSDLEQARTMVLADKRQLSQQDAKIALRVALITCETIEDIVDVLAAHLLRLGITRCFLALHERGHDERASPGETRVLTDEARVVLAYRDGTRLVLDDGLVSPTHRLLPVALRPELDHGMLVLQPLAVLDRALGHLLFEQRDGADAVTALMKTDLSRAIDTVLTTRELEARNQELEQQVGSRTRHLEAEVVSRHRTERELQRANVILQRSAKLDGLTQLANRAALEEHLEDQWLLHAREGREIAFLMVDVDAFKLYNDHYGHLCGDEALRRIAACLERSIDGPNALAGRYGGEEFSVTLPGCSGPAALAVAARFRARLATAAIPHAASPVGPVLTVSIGVAAAVPVSSHDPRHLVAAADRALYLAKADGRDRIAVAPDRHDSTVLPGPPSRLQKRPEPPIGRRGTLCTPRLAPRRDAW